MVVARTIFNIHAAASQERYPDRAVSGAWFGSRNGLPSGLQSAANVAVQKVRKKVAGNANRLSSTDGRGNASIPLRRTCAWQRCGRGDVLAGSKCEKGTW
jgi:hypothetical protein